MKNITLSADADLIEAARQRAAAERTTLNARFRQWLEDYAAVAGSLRRPAKAGGCCDGCHRFASGRHFHRGPQVHPRRNE